MDDDGDQLPGCAACQFIGRICPPDCALAPHFVSREIHTTNFATLKGLWKGKNATETAQSYRFQLRHIFVEGAVKFFAGDSAGEEGRRLLVEAILSEVEKETEPLLEPAGFSTSSSTDPEFSSPVGISSLTRAFARVAWRVADWLPVQDYQDSSLDGAIRDDGDGDDNDAHEVELADSEKLLEESGTSSGVDQNLGVNADQDSILASDKD